MNEFESMYAEHHNNLKQNWTFLIEKIIGYAKSLEKRHIDQLFSIYQDTLSDEGEINI